MQHTKEFGADPPSPRIFRQQYNPFWLIITLTVANLPHSSLKVSWWCDLFFYPSLSAVQAPPFQQSRATNHLRSQRSYSCKSLHLGVFPWMSLNATTWKWNEIRVLDIRNIISRQMRLGLPVSLLANLKKIKETDKLLGLLLNKILWV